MILDQKHWLPELRVEAYDMILINTEKIQEPNPCSLWDFNFFWNIRELRSTQCDDDFKGISLYINVYNIQYNMIFFFIYDLMLS